MAGLNFNAQDYSSCVSELTSYIDYITEQNSAAQILSNNLSDYWIGEDAGVIKEEIDTALKKGTKFIDSIKEFIGKLNKTSEIYSAVEKDASDSAKWTESGQSNGE